MESRQAAESRNLAEMAPSVSARPQPGPAPLLLCGYYGEHNLGDDALLEVLLEQLGTGIPVVVTAHDQRQVEQRFEVATVPRRRLGAVLTALGRCRGLVLGGGSLLQDATSFKSLLYYGALITAARLQGKPVVLWGQGLGPLRRRRSRLLVRALLPLATAIVWRDAASARLAAALGRTDPSGADPVWASEPQQWLGRGGPIVVCLRPTAQLAGEAWRPYLEALDQLATAAERPVIWLPFHGQQDRALFADLQAQGLLPQGLARRSRQVQALTPREAKAVFASAGLVVAMRLHGLILAAVSGAPTVALSYDPKVQAAALDLGCPCQVLDAQASTADLLGIWQDQLDQPPPRARLQELRQRTLPLIDLLRI